MKKVKSMNAFGKEVNVPLVKDNHVSLPPRKQLMDNRKYLLAAKADQVIAKAISKALDDEDKDQGMMIKMLMDRMLPMSEFEARKDGSRSQVTITISGVGDTKVAGETIDAEDA